MAHFIILLLIQRRKSYSDDGGLGTLRTHYHFRQLMAPLLNASSSFDDHFSIDWHYGEGVKVVPEKNR
jgi:hypothetical protein